MNRLWIDIGYFCAGIFTGGFAIPMFKFLIADYLRHSKN